MSRTTRTVAVAPKAGISTTNLQHEMLALPSVASVQPVLSFAETIRDMVNQVLDILRVMEGAVSPQVVAGHDPDHAPEGPQHARCADSGTFGHGSWESRPCSFAAP